MIILRIRHAREKRCGLYGRVARGDPRLDEAVCIQRQDIARLERYRLFRIGHRCRVAQTRSRDGELERLASAKEEGMVLTGVRVFEVASLEIEDPGEKGDDEAGCGAELEVHAVVEPAQE